jgi:hypothetical protein
MPNATAKELGKMAQATLTRVLKDIRTLNSDELRQVRGIVDEQLTTTETEDPDEAVLQAMLRAGLINEIKRPDRRPNPERPLVPIIGKPLSETIVEERRLWRPLSLCNVVRYSATNPNFTAA